MSNSLLNISMITKESLRILKNQLGFAKGCNRQYDGQFSKSGAKIGDTINIRKPVRYTVTDGAALDLQNQVDQSVALTVDQQKHVAFQFSSKEMSLNIDEFSARYLKPAIVALCNKIDLDGLALYKDVYQSSGTPGTTPNTFQFLTDTATKLDDAAAPVGDGMRHLCINPKASGRLADALKALQHPTKEISEQYRKGHLYEAAGFNVAMDQNIGMHLVGTYAGTPLVNGASQSGSSLITDGWSSTSLKQGDVFTIDGVYAVNPQSRVSTGELQQFTVTADVSDSGGDMTIAISPSITTSGQYQTVDSSPANNAAINMVGSSNTQYPQNIGYHRDAFVLGMADLPLPGGVDMAARASDDDAGLSVRIVKAYDINNDTFPCRIDVLYGWKTVYPELACRLWG